MQPLEVPISAVGGGAIAGQPGSAAIDMGPDTPEVSQFYAHDAAICRTNGSTEPKRSTASFSAA
jgi:hypothetical protein